MARAAKLAFTFAIFGATCGAGRVPAGVEPITGPRASLWISPVYATLPVGGMVEARAKLRIYDPRSEFAGCFSVYWTWGDGEASGDEPRCRPDLVDTAATEFRVFAWHKYRTAGEMHVRVLVAAGNRVRAADTGVVTIAGAGQ